LRLAYHIPEELQIRKIEVSNVDWLGLLDK
jgi:hypothetical protein